MKNIEELYKAIQILTPQAVTVDITTGGTQVDVEQYNDDAMFIVSVGNADADESGDPGSGLCDVAIETSTNGTDFTEALTFAQLGISDDNKIAAKKLNLSGIKEVRVAVDVAGVTPSFTLSVVALVKPDVGGASTNPDTFA